MAFCDLHLGTALTALNRFDEARAVLDDALDLIEQRGNRKDQAEVHRVLGELLWQQPTPDWQGGRDGASLRPSGAQGRGGQQDPRRAGPWDGSSFVVPPAAGAARDRCLRVLACLLLKTAPADLLGKWLAPRRCRSCVPTPIARSDYLPSRLATVNECSTIAVEPVARRSIRRARSAPGSSCTLDSPRGDRARHSSGCWCPSRGSGS